MDRLTQTLIGCGLALLASATGCRSTRDEVPPGRAFRKDGTQEPAVAFSTKPHDAPPSAFGGQVGGAPGNMGTSATPMQPPGDFTGTMPGSKFGSPGTSGLGAPPTLGGPALDSSNPPDMTQSPPPRAATRMGSPADAPPPY